ncbi:MAG: tRNA pseudouridine(38-40) synthase TruA [Alphaproteobacteria bacterium]|nr:MAG: tRNA pseudouridine(38-40) synthase TruA [Alphaproteobacteria bacterium]
MTQRWKITVEYDGSLYAGWQFQQHDMSIQQALEEAVFAFSGESPRLSVAGRTDAGVHALGQVAHFDLERESTEKTVRDAVNAKLREQRHHGISVVTAEPVSEEFHARFGAQNRVYIYRILAARAAPPALLRNRVWHMRDRLDITAMNAGAQHLLGHHDFSSFRAAGCQANSPLRTVSLVEVTEDADAAYGAGQAISVRVEAKSFLYHQVRNIVGSLVPVGTGKWQPEKIAEILAACDRTKAAATAPAHGLYFARVDY